MAYRIRYGKEKANWNLPAFALAAGVLLGLMVLRLPEVEPRQELVALCQERLLEAGYVP